MRRSSLERQRGQVLVLSAAVMTFLFVPLCVFVIDSALIDSNYAQLGDVLQAAAEDGASQIDQAAFRASDGKMVVLDEQAARGTAERAIQVSGIPGVESSSVTVTAAVVTASARVRVQLVVLGPTTLHQTRSASFAVGQ